MLASKKITSVKVLQADQCNIFVKGYVKKSYGTRRPAFYTILLLSPIKSTLRVCNWCEWSTVCCHVQAVLLLTTLHKHKRKDSRTHMHATNTNMI